MTSRVNNAKLEQHIYRADGTVDARRRRNAARLVEFRESLGGGRVVGGGGFTNFRRLSALRYLSSLSTSQSRGMCFSVCWAISLLLLTRKSKKLRRSQGICAGRLGRQGSALELIEVSVSLGAPAHPSRFAPQRDIASADPLGAR